MSAEGGVGPLAAAGALGAAPVLALSESQRAHLALRLSQASVDRTDRGQVLPRTAAALALPATQDAGATRLEALVAALATERVIVPIDVEADPRVTGVHPGLTGEGPADGHAGVEWLRFPTPVGPALAVFTSATALQAARPGARPMPLEVRKVALTALVETKGRILVDAPGAPDNVAHGGILLPRPATAALAQGDSWLPAWRDTELLAELHGIAGASAVTEAIVDIQVIWAGEGLVRVAVLVDRSAAGAPGVRARLGALFQDLGRSPRLLAATDRVEITPIPVDRRALVDDGTRAHSL